MKNIYIIWKLNHILLLRKGFRDTNNLPNHWYFFKAIEKFENYCGSFNTDTWTTFWWFQIVDSYLYRWVSIIFNDPVMRGFPGQCKVFRDTLYLNNAVCEIKELSSICRRTMRIIGRVVMPKYRNTCLLCNRVNSDLVQHRILLIKDCRYSFMKMFPIIDFIQTLCMSRTWCCTMKKQIKIIPYRGCLFFISYQRCHILNIFYKFHKTSFRHKIIKCIIRIAYIILFFS